MHGDSLYWKYGRNFILDGLLIQNVANIQSGNAFIGEFDFQKRGGSLFLQVHQPW